LKLGIIDFETMCSYTWVCSNISSIAEWSVLTIDPIRWIEKLEEYSHNYNRMFWVNINDGEYFSPLILEKNN
jgi:hypothetical protein